MDDAAVPTDVYRLKGPSLEITYRLAHGELTFKVGDLDFHESELSGSCLAPAVAQPDVGRRVDAELLSEGETRIVLTLLLPEIVWQGVDAQTAQLSCAAIITRRFWSTYEDRVPYALQHYDVRELKGTASLRV